MESGDDMPFKPLASEVREIRKIANTHPKSGGVDPPTKRGSRIEINGKVCCSRCQKPFSITKLALICDCERIVISSIDCKELRKKYPKQRQDSPADEIQKSESEQA